MAKRRVAVPKKFLQELGSKMIITKWYENCLVLVSEQQWLALLNRLFGGAKAIIGPVRGTERFIFGSAYQVKADGQGRIVVPEKLAQHAGFSHEIIFIGLGDRVEIWNKDNWEHQEEAVAKKAANLLERMASHEW